jgi:hypothetical protein
MCHEISRQTISSAAFRRQSPHRLFLASVLWGKHTALFLADIWPIISGVPVVLTIAGLNLKINGFGVQLQIEGTIGFTFLVPTIVFQ